MHSLIKGARPIKSSQIRDHYNRFEYSDVSLADYTEIWRDWLTYTDLKTLDGLEHFKYADYTQGTSQTFDNFVLKHGKEKTIFAMRGDFQYHACISKFSDFDYIDSDFKTSKFFGLGLAAVIVSAPFSDYGCMHPEFEKLMEMCDFYKAPVCLDLAYWGISKNIHIDLNKYPMITEVTCSLSKPFYSLENHRVGVRFTREYTDDGISMINEVNMQNNYSMSLGAYFMKNFSPDWNWDTFGQQYEDVCNDQGLVYTDTVIFGLGDEARHKSFNRGVFNNYRVCVSEFLGDLN